MKKIIALLLISFGLQGQTLLKFKQIEQSGATGSLVITTGTNGVLTYTPQIPYSKITGTPSLSGYIPYTGANSFTTTNNITANVFIPTSSIVIGSPTYTDNNIWSFYQGSANNYYQSILQNSSNGSAASVDFVVSNDLGTKTNYYGNFGMNSSGYTGSPIFSKPNAVYLTAQDGDLCIGTTSNNAIHIAANNASSDAITVNSSNNTTVSGTFYAGSTATVNGALLANSTSTLSGSNVFGTSASSNIHNIYTGSSSQASISIQGRIGSTTQPAIYLGGQAPSATDYNFCSTNNGSTTFVNANGDVRLQYSGTDRVIVGNTSTSISNSVNIGSGTYGTDNLHQLRVTKGTATVDIGEQSAGEASMWFNQNTPSTTNYNFRKTGSLFIVGDNTRVQFRVNDIQHLDENRGNTTWTHEASQAGGSVSEWVFTGVANAVNHTASTNIPLFKITGATKTFATGALTTQYFNHLSANTIAFAGASTATDVYGLFVEKSVPGTNATITRNWGIGTDGSALITQSCVIGAAAKTPGTSVNLDVTGGIASTGNISSTSKTAGIGYAVGSGSTVTQATSRTTGVTINSITGQVTLVSQAGQTTYQSFTMTNSSITAKDVLLISWVTSTDIYIHSTKCAAGSAVISLATTGGTTVEAPVFNFTVIKGQTN